MAKCLHFSCLRAVCQCTFTKKSKGEQGWIGAGKAQALKQQHRNEQQWNEEFFKDKFFSLFLLQTHFRTKPDRENRLCDAWYEQFIREQTAGFSQTLLDVWELGQGLDEPSCPQLLPMLWCAPMWQPHLKEIWCILTLIKLLMCPPLAKSQDEIPYRAFYWC